MNKKISEALRSDIKWEEKQICIKTLLNENSKNYVKHNLDILLDNYKKKFF